MSHLLAGVVFLNVEAENYFINDIISELINFLQLRTDKHAHFEIRHIANEMRRAISESLATKYIDEILKEMEL